MHGRESRVTRLTFSAVTGRTVGSTKITLASSVHSTAYRLIQKLHRPRCHGPGSNLPLIILQMIGMQYDQSSAMAVTLKMAAAAV